MDTLNIEKYGFNHTGNIFRNNPPGALVEKALLHKEGRLSRAGALCKELVVLQMINILLIHLLFMI